MNKEISNEMLVEMLKLQCGINAQVHLNWPEQRYPWHLAIMTEASEGIEHLSFKWWKAGVINLEQAQLELVDVWHFGMSLLLQQIGSVEATAGFINMERDLYKSKENIDPINSFTDIIATASALKDFRVVEFEALLESLNMSWGDLYLWYIGKNALNTFRQENGYKTGDYIKTWQGREDNEFLADILKQETVNGGLFARVYEQLDFIYQPLKNEKVH